MYSSRGGNAYGQQSYAAGQQAYGQNAVGAEGSRHSLLGGSQDADNIAGYRAAAAAQYGGQYGSLYGSSTLSSVQQAAMSAKAAGSLASGDYVSSSSHGYGQKADQFSGKIPDYPSLERRNYGDHQSAYIGRDLQSEPARRYAESAGLGPQHKPEIYDHVEQASLLRQQQILKSQALQSASLDGGARPADYLAARGAVLRHANQDLASYGGRMDADPHNLSMLGGSSYGQHQASILGAAPRRNVEDLVYAQGSSTAGYGVSLPPGRDYAAGKGIRGASLENDYPGGLLSRGGSRIDERKDDRGGFHRDLEIRDEERRKREREKEREREKDRERERERKRERERRDKEKERERKRGPDISRRELTPPRLARDRHGSSLLKEERSLRRDSPRRDALHRRHSPVREKRREYVCKVHPSSLVEVERDYRSIIKRYPNLSISPEFSKVVLNWPKGKLELSIHTPISFEHDVIDLESPAEQKKPSSKPLSEESGQSRVGSVVWNAKVILMSGLSKNALEDLSSDKSFDDRIPHINNILRFAFLRRDRSFMAIGGQWDDVDGGDPSIDDSSLVQTALRHAKDLVQLDLRTCQKWNRFLEIHYDRVGNDGLFSHKEITVLFIPDLSDCLPSLSAWRDQWLAHRKSMIEKERLISSKTEKSAEKDAVVKRDKSHTKSDKDVESSKIVKIEGKPLKKEKESHGKLSDQPVDGKKTKEEGGSDVQDNQVEKEKVKNEVEGGVDKKGTETVPSSAEIQKPGKRKLVKKVLKQKVVDKKAAGENSTGKGNEKLDKKEVVDKQGQAEARGQHDEVTVEPSSAKTSVRKKVVKKVPVLKSAKKENKGTNSDGIQTEGTPGKDQEDRLKDEMDTESAVIPEGGVKTTTKKKVIKRVPKKKGVDMEGKGAIADKTIDVDKDENGHETEKTKDQTGDGGTPALEVKKTEKKDGSKTVSKVEKEDDGVSKTEKEIKDGKGKEGKGTNDKRDSGTKIETEATKGKGSDKDSHDDKKETMKDEKDKKDRKDESRQKSNKETKEKGKSVEPPQHPGFILQAKRTKESKIRSMSLSLDSLLDYNDKDIEESTFELSLFAESMYEMLQYQMGCRLLAFLQNLRLNFVKKRNELKRQREENPKESEKENSRKRLKTNDESPKENNSAKPEMPDVANEDEKQSVAKEESCADGIDDSKMDNESDDYDPEEDVNEDQEMDDASNENDESEEAENEDEVTGTEAEPVKDVTEQKDETKVVAELEGKSNVEEAKDKAAEIETKEKAKPAVKETTVDKELLQAFRFFDRNRVGYIKVEDMRFILHNLGQFLSHRDVKELVQSALLESNTARDNRILYNKLVRS